MAFTTEEKTIIKMYSGFTLGRDSLLVAMRQNIHLVEQPDIAELMAGVIRKINAMTDADIQKIDLSNALDFASPED